MPFACHNLVVTGIIPFCFVEKQAGEVYKIDPDISCSTVPPYTSQLALSPFFSYTANGFCGGGHLPIVSSELVSCQQEEHDACLALSSKSSIQKDLEMPFACQLKAFFDLVVAGIIPFCFVKKLAGEVYKGF